MTPETQSRVEKSELKQLLEKNAGVTAPLFTEQDYWRARQLIEENPTPSEDDCWVCTMARPRGVRKAIFDTHLCPGHALRALNERK